MTRAKSVESRAERRVWNLLVQNFEWQVPQDLGVKVFSNRGASLDTARLQIFEIAIARIFARLHPDHEWYVTPARPDGGTDFVGKRLFLTDPTLDISAAITIGGQCKKRTRVGNLVDLIAGDLAKMMRRINPTFFVVAFSARLDPGRVKEAKETLELALRRDCHILDRRQIEGLIYYHRAALDDILRAALSEEEVIEVVRYFEKREPVASTDPIDAIPPKSVRAGVTFRVPVDIRSSVVAAREARLWWRKRTGDDAAAPHATLLGPVGADSPAGIALARAGDLDVPVRARHYLEFVTYSTGRVDLGEVCVALDVDGPGNAVHRKALGSVRVVEAMVPPFFDRPYAAGRTRLEQEYEQADAGAVVAVGVIGAGGSGKSRLCREFCLEKRRRGGDFVSASQAKTHNNPESIIADLLVDLAADDFSALDPAKGVVQAISRYDRALAERAAPAIERVLGLNKKTSSEGSEQDILSSLVLLMATRRRQAPLIVHLQDLHWAAADVLLMLDHLVWQLSTRARLEAGTSGPGVLFLMEGRIGESQGRGEDATTSVIFEAFLEKLDCPKVLCSSFAPEDRLEFIRRLFVQDHNVGSVNEELARLQGVLIERINRVAGGNPFHSLETVRFLREKDALGQNPETGLLYMIQPEPAGALLPDPVFDSIQLRWEYLKNRKPQLALLHWAAALLEDRLPIELFRWIWSELAPDVSLREVDATDILWTGDGEEREVSFRHENYFHSLRRFTVTDQDRERAGAAYSAWYDSQPTLGPADKFRWARVLLKMPHPDARRVKGLLAGALRGARRAGDSPLARRIAATSLDLGWREDARVPAPISKFLRLCDEELDLTRTLLGSDRGEARRRLANLQDRLVMRTTRGAPSHATIKQLQRRQLTAETVRSRILFNDREPVRAAEVAAEVVAGVKALRPDSATGDADAWETLEIEARYAHAVALALSGEDEQALQVAERAAAIARGRSSQLSIVVISTYARILLSKDPSHAESILRSSLGEVADDPRFEGVKSHVEIFLAMSLAVQAHRLEAPAPRRASLLNEASELLTGISNESFQLGRYPVAGSAAVMRGIVSALKGDDDEVYWFARAVAATNRGNQMETLWRAHINLATAFYRNEGSVTHMVRDHARAALKIMKQTVPADTRTGQSPRFAMLRVPLAHAVAFLIRAGDDEGLRTLESYPALRACFQDPRKGILRQDRGGADHAALRIGEGDYILY